MFKTFAAALCMAMAMADSDFRHTLPVDAKDSTKEVGLLLWKPFYQKYIDSLYSDLANAPAQFDQDRHLCYFRWVFEKPFETLDERYSIAVTHNCPADIIHSITFDLDVEDVNGAFIVHDYDTSHHTETDTGIHGIVLHAKTEAGEGDNQDFGFWHPKIEGEVPTWTYTYRFRYPGDDVVTSLGEHDYTTADVTGDFDATNAENLGASLSAADLPAYSDAEAAYALPDDFVTAGKVSLTKVEGADQGRYFAQGAGCRRLTFSNGIEEHTTGWLGGDAGCLDHIDGSSEVTISTIADVDYSEGMFTEHVALWNYFEEGDVGERRTLQYQRGFSLGMGMNFGTTEEADFVFPQTIAVREDQTICGVSYRRQSFTEEDLDAASNTYINWRPTICTISSA